MSMHKIELTDLERKGLELHRLPIGTPSQSSDCFRNGIKWALENTRTQSQWISDQLAPALNKCFKSKIGCDGMLMVAVDDYNELVDLINKAAALKEQDK